MWPFNKKAPEVKPARKRRKMPVLSNLQRSLFEAADPDRNNSSWDSTPIPIGRIINQKQHVLVARSREQISNNDYAKGLVKEVRKNLLGHKGVTLQVRGLEPDGSLDDLGNAAVEKAWKKWSKRENCSVDGRLSLMNQARQTINTVVGSGEMFIRIIEGEEAGPWGFSIQLFDPQRIPVDLNERNLRNGNVIRHGIEMNQHGRVIAYYVQVTAGILAEPFRLNGKEFDRIPADEIRHIYDMVDPEQYRGLPWNASSLKRLRNLSGFEDAAVVNARASACKTMVLKSDPEVFEVEDDEFEEPEVNLEPNETVVLPPGFEPVNYSPDFPSGDVASFSKHMLRGVSSGQYSSYNKWANDLEGVNFSSIRSGTISEQDSWKELQEWFIEAFYQFIYERWLQYSLLAGKIITPSGRPIPANRLDKFLNVEWQARRWDWVDPLKDEKATTEATANMRKSPGEAIRESGRDPREVWNAYASDIKAMREAGIPEDKINQFLGIKETADVEASKDTDSGDGE